jgi:hypothetical protein
MEPLSQIQLSSIDIRLLAGHTAEFNSFLVKGTNLPESGMNRTLADPNVAFYGLTLRGGWPDIATFDARQ